MRNDKVFDKLIDELFGENLQFSKSKWYGKFVEMNPIDLIVEKNNWKKIKDCVSFPCPCRYSIGVPKKYLTNNIQAFNIECPVCGYKFIGYGSLKSCT